MIVKTAISRINQTGMRDEKRNEMIVQVRRPVQLQPGKSDQIAATATPTMMPVR
jgi:hypothetical protein